MPLVFKAFTALLRYEIALRFGGFKQVYEGLRRMPVAQCTAPPETIVQINEAVSLAACFYWKPLLCLPRAVVTTRLLRQRGVSAQLIIGYRPSPFMSHAWVEVDGGIVNDSPVLQERLLVLDRL